MNHIDVSINFPHQPQDVLPNCISSSIDGAGHGDERWRLLWREPMQTEHLSKIRSVVEKVTPCKNVLVLGIGGSALGTKALYSALSTQKSTPLFVLDNIDPNTFTKTINQIRSNDPDCSNTAVVVVSKSGGTAEISALLMATQQEFPEATYIAVTGLAGILHQYANEQGWDILPIPDGVGGRFSVLSPVGLMPIALCGISIESLLEGARLMDDRCLQKKGNPAGDFSSALVAALQEGRNIHVMMPYCDRLIQFAHWYVQLWAESLGKIDSHGVRIGPNPIAAIGATDQHSMLQLWREGPTDKVIGFLLAQEDEDIKLSEDVLDSSQSWLKNKTMAQLLQAEQQATQRAVEEAGQVTWTIKLHHLNGHSIGQFIAFWQATVAISSRLLKVNGYNQPGVELGKRLTKDALSGKK